MVAIIVLILIFALFGLGFVVNFLWYVVIAAVILWLLGFFVGGVHELGTRRRWYGRW